MKLLKYHEIVKTLYPDYGMIYTCEQTGLTRGQVSHIARTLKLYIKSSVRSKIHSEIRLKQCKKPEEFNVNHETFLTVDSELKAYMLGLLWADGSIQSNGAKQTVIFSTTHPDSEYFEKIFNESGKWNKYVIENKNGWKTCVRLVTNNKFFVQKLKELGFCDRKSGFKKILEHISEKYRWAWFLGFSDGDGCFHVNISRGAYRFSFCSCFEQDWDSITEIVNNLGIEFKVERCKSVSGNYSKIHITSKYRVKKWGEFLYQADLGLPRKREKFLLIQNQCIPKRDRLPHSTRNAEETQIKFS